jgi:pyridoxamine 5'-phosphate oxidase
VDVTEVDALRARLRTAPMAARRLPGFDPAAAGADPAPLFAAWLLRALDEGVPEPHVMTLATVDAAGRPDARVLVLRGVDDTGGACGFRFASDAGSRKGAELAARPYAALTWYWPAQGRQVRAAGPVEALDRATADADFRSRSEASRIAALTGAMSAPLTGPEAYESAREAARDRLAAAPGTVPDGHTVYLLRAAEVEFFQLAADRFHRRLRYRRTDRGWDREQLWP